MVKFQNVSGRPQVIYLPTTVADDARYVIDVGHSIEVDDQRDIDSLRRLSGFVEVASDSPTLDYRSSRMSL